MAKNKIKILFIHHGTGIGGAPISLLNLIKRLDKSKFQLKVAFMVRGEIVDFFKKEDIETEIIGGSTTYFGHHEKGKIQFKFFWRYPKIILSWYKTRNKLAPIYLKKNKEYDIIHLNSDVLSSWASAAKQLGFKVVCHNRDPIAKGTFGLRRYILKYILNKNVNQFICISHDNKSRLGLPQKTDVIYNFVDIPNTFRESMLDSTIEKRVLYLGGMAKVKGFVTAVACLPYLDPNITLQFAGNLSKWNRPISSRDKVIVAIKLLFFGKTYWPLKKMYKAKNAQILGLLYAPLPIIDASDILISPFKIEHFSRPAVEAFAYGKPVIGSDVEGMDEIVDHGLNGLLVKKNNPKALATAINYLCSHPEKAREMGLEGREKAEKIFSPEINTKKVENIYQQLINK